MKKIPSLETIINVHEWFPSVYRTEYPPEAENEDQEDEDEAEVTLEKVEEEMAEMYEDGAEEEEENIMHLDDLADLTQTLVWALNFPKIWNPES